MSIPRVSSILDDDYQFDKSNLIDGKLETCWNSDEGEAQFIYCKFSQPVNISHFELTYQGGFGAKHLSVAVGVPIPADIAQNADDDDSDEEEATKTNKIGLKTVAEFASQDASSTQSFAFSAGNVHAIKITMTDMADMFGRVIIYNLNIFGPSSQ